MTIKKMEMTGSWSLKLPFYFLSFYFFILLPIDRLLLNHTPWVSKYSYDIFLAGVLLYLFFLKRNSPSDLGLSFRNIKQNLLIGGLPGGSILLSLPVLDALVKLTGLDQTELLKNVISRPNGGINLWLPTIFILVHAVMEQAFLSGFIVQTLLRKHNPILVIYTTGILFTLLHLSFNLSSFIIGLFTAYGYFLTRTIVAPIIFQVCCNVSRIMLESFYSHLITIVGFLF